MIVNQGMWCQVHIPTDADGIRRAVAILKREGYSVSVYNMGIQVTDVGKIKMTLISISKGTRDDTFGATAILEAHIPKLIVNERY